MNISIEIGLILARLYEGISASTLRKNIWYANNVAKTKKLKKVFLLKSKHYSSKPLYMDFS